MIHPCSVAEAAATIPQELQHVYHILFAAMDTGIVAETFVAVGLTEIQTYFLYRWRWLRHSRRTARFSYSSSGSVGTNIVPSCCCSCGITFGPCSNSGTVANALSSHGAQQSIAQHSHSHGRSRRRYGTISCKPRHFCSLVRARSG